MRRRIGLVIALLAGLLAVGAASAASITLGEAANGKTVRVHVGDVVRIELPSNASTGYSWEVAAIDGAKLRIVSALYTPPKPKTPPIVGASGTYTLTLRVRTAGRSTPRLEYVGPARSFTVGKRFAVILVAD